MNSKPASIKYYSLLPSLLRVQRAIRRFQSSKVECRSRCFQAFVTEHLLYVFYVLGSVVFHSCFPMAKRVQVDLLEPGVLEYSSESCSLFSETCTDRVCPSVEYIFPCFLHIV